MKAEDILKELIDIRAARKAKFVPYEIDRQLKRRERRAWQLAEDWGLATFSPDAYAAKVAAEDKMRQREADAAAKRVRVKKKAA